MMIIVNQASFTTPQKDIINDVLTLSQSKWGSSNLLPTVLEIKANYRLRTTAGKAHTNRKENRAIIEMNYRLFNSTGTLENFENTFKHELAHIYANFLYGVNCNHNKKWQGIFKQLGGNGERCHTMEVNHLRPKVKRYSYACGCTTHRLSKTRHNRIINKNAKYSCKLCGESLAYIGIE